ncbi:MAG: twin-arginine translocase TatA/TatE family subunit [Anaerolineae bacterium]|jgi:sec-independent protein translocase protein TatA|nr:twin-arginine translocase TatA/TatE family subunit [Anaerolineae bacterium]
MPIRFGPLELTILLVIVILLFGPGRIGKIAGEIGKSIKSFRDGLGNKDEEGENKPSDTETKN